MARNKKRIICWDSCVIIDSFNKKSNRFPPIDEMLQQAENGNLKIVVSGLAAVETYKLDGKSSKEAEKLIENFLRRSYVDYDALSSRVSRKAREIRRDWEHEKLDLLDTVHIATAVIRKCEALVTTDGIKKGRSKGKLLLFDGKIGSPPLRIITPSELTEMWYAPLMSQTESTNYDKTVANKRKNVGS